MAKIYSWKIGTCQQGEVALFMPQLFNQFTQIWVKMVHVKTKIINSTLLNVVISHEVILDPVLVFKSKSIMSVTALTADSLIHCSTKHRLCDIIVYGRCLVVSNCALFSQGCTAVRFLTWQQGWQRWAPLTLFSHHTFGPWCTPECAGMCTRKGQLSKPFGKSCTQHIVRLIKYGLFIQLTHNGALLFTRCLFSAK